MNPASYPHLHSPYDERYRSKALRVWAGDMMDNSLKRPQGSTRNYLTRYRRSSFFLEKKKEAKKNRDVHIDESISITVETRGHF